MHQENGMSLMIKISQNMVKEMKMIQASRDRTATRGNENTKFRFRNWNPSTRCATPINNEHFDNPYDNPYI